MESANSNTVISSPINDTIEIKIKDFRTSSNVLITLNEKGKTGQDLRLYFAASTYPHGVDEDSEGWLVVRAYVMPIRTKYMPQNGEVSWTVSVIDIEGNARFPKSFMQDISKKYDDDYKYLERSFILNRADDFLPEDVLTLRCDICYKWYSFAPASSHDHNCLILRDIPLFISGLMRGNNPEPGDLDRINDIFTSVCISKCGQIIPIIESSSASSDSESKEARNSRVWIFETRNKSFNIILDEQLDELGGRLLKASPVLRRCVNAPMKEQREKRIELSEFDSQTFCCAVYFILNQMLPNLEFDELLEVYKFSHIYQMEKLQRKCAEDMMEHDSDFEELQKIADFYSDEYLSDLFYIHRHGDGNLERDLPHYKMDDKPNSQCYI